MGFMTPTVPDIDLAEFRQRSFLQRVQVISRNWVEHGFGSPWSVYLVHLVKIALYVVVGYLVMTATTPQIGPLSTIADWWAQPVVFQKAVLWTVLWEILGLGCGSGPLMWRFLPPIGGLLYFLRPDTVRLPPWPTRVPLTSGNRRTVFDVVLYVAILTSISWPLVSAPTGSPPMVAPVHLVAFVVLLPIAGLRDKTIMLAARFENYWIYVLMFFFPFASMILGAKLVAVILWVAVALSKVNLHFSYVVPIMISNSPLQQSKWLKRRMYRDFPTDLRPSRLGACLAYTGVFFESVPPLILLFSRGGALTWALVAAMVAWHLHIVTTMPQGGPLEWNVFFSFATIWLFGTHADIGFGALTPGIALIITGMALMPLVGNIRPDLVSFLPAMRYYAGNWNMSYWCFRKASGAEDTIDNCVVKSAPSIKAQLARVYDDEMVDWMFSTANAFIAMHLNGRGLTSLLFHALDDPDDYDIRLGDLVAGTVVGWNFGDGHMSDEHLLGAVQERCRYTAGELIVVMLESQPAHRLWQKYRIVDAAGGEIESGSLSVRDLAAAQPWLVATNPVLPLHEVRRRRPVDAG